MVAWAAIIPAVKAAIPVVGKAIGTKIGGDFLGKMAPKLGSALGGIGGLLGGSDTGIGGNNSFSPQVYGGQVQNSQIPATNMYSMITGQKPQEESFYNRLIN